jgi:hypothetical protein
MSYKYSSNPNLESHSLCLFFLMAQQPLEDHGFLLVKALRSHLVRHATHSLGLLWMSEQFDAETCA